MIDVANTGCCGCSVCADACPFDAITMKADGMGFRYPHIDRERCRDCGICDRVCPMVGVGTKAEKTPKVYAACHRNTEEVASSRSGAAFVALSDVILDNGGIVYGASIDSNFHVNHTRAVSREERDTLKGSKYVQSATEGIYKSVKADLAADRQVMFVGTPCQCAGLVNMLPAKLRDNLVIVDMVCHGVASDAVWGDFLKMVERKEKKKITSVNFRDKGIYGWSGLHRESFTMENGRKVVMPITFYQSFLLRSDCHKCPFSSVERVADITLGDLWGWEKIKDLDNKGDRGLSMVMCNTAKGRELLKAASADLELKGIDLSDAMQPNLMRPTPEDPQRAEFEQDYTAYGFEYVRKKYYPISLTSKVKYMIKRLMGKY